ncbi:protein-lysine N-methyltransferase SMYD4-like [Tubulanus polymorphus]|uniref:protein-lysine N-methyltransferase SMYD4-like n=1 Tax=Tubulanus polymorphus TaxID=672921 RepID=UPI003DA3D1F8
MDLAEETGWQPHLAGLLNRLKRTGDYHEFRAIETDSRRVLFCAQKNYLRELSMKWPNDGLNEKSTKTAVELRNQGNKYFQKEKYNDALLKYNESILKAPRDDESLSVGFANRSAVSFHNAHYNVALKDIALSLDAGYPDKLAYKIYKRRGQCHEYLGRYDDAKQAYSSALQFLNEYTTHLKPDVKSGHIDDLTKLLKNVETKLNKPTAVEAKKTDGDGPKNLPKLSYGENESIPAATSRIKVKIDSKTGRSLIAADDLRAGDNLIIEEPYVSTQLLKFERERCHHCYAVTKYPVPCNQCSRVVYCSKECQMESWHQYHYIECQILYILYETGLAHLCSRLVIKTGIPYLKKFHERLKSGSSSTAAPGFTEDGKYLNDYEAVYSLLTHTEKLNVDDLFYYSMTAVLLTSLVKRRGFFDTNVAQTNSQNQTASSTDGNQHLNSGRAQLHDDEQPVFTDFEIFVGGLMLRHFQQFICNAQAITNVTPDTTNDKHSMMEGYVYDVSEKRIGVGIYPTASLMNHSCQPTVLCSYQGKKLIVRCTEKTRKGCDVFNCYGPHYKRMNTEQRRQILREQYYFECQCTACMNDMSAATWHMLACVKCSGPIVDLVCNECKHRIDADEKDNRLLAASEPMEKASDLVDQRRFAEALDYLKKNYDFVKKSFYKYNRSLGSYEDLLSLCYIEDNSYYNPCLSLEHLGRSLAIVEQNFGRRSLEYAKELCNKLIPILGCSGRYADLLKTIDEALEILNVFCPENDEEIVELKFQRRKFQPFVANCGR